MCFFVPFVIFVDKNNSLSKLPNDARILSRFPASLPFVVFRDPPVSLAMRPPIKLSMITPFYNSLSMIGEAMLA